MRLGLVILFLSVFLSGDFVTTPGARARLQDPQKPPSEKTEPTEDVISVETNLIVVNATVTDALENYVSGLKAEDFKILEDTAPQRILDLTVEEAPSPPPSCSTRAEAWGISLLARAACGNFLSELRDGDMAAVYSFSGFKVKCCRISASLATRLTPSGREGPRRYAALRRHSPVSRRARSAPSGVAPSSWSPTAPTPRVKPSLDEATRKTLDANALIYVDMSDRAVFRSERKDNGAEVLKMLAAKTGGRSI